MNFKKLFGFSFPWRNLMLVTGLFALLLLVGVVRAADQLSLPPLPAGYEKWVHQENRCVFTNNEGKKFEYTLNLYQRDLPAKGLFNGIEIHRLDGEPYLVSRFVSRHVGQGFTRGDTVFFIRQANENKWTSVSFSDAFIWGTREFVNVRVNRDYLSTHGTNTNAIKDCLRAQSKSNQQ